MAQGAMGPCRSSLLKAGRIKSPRHLSRERMNFKRLTTEEEVTAFASTIPGSVFALDCETTGLNPRVDQILSIAIAPHGEAAVSIPAEFIPLLAPLKEAALLILHNFKFDYHVLYEHGLDLRNVPFLDTLHMHHLIDERKDHDLGSIVLEEFGDNYKDKFWSKYKNYSDAGPQDALEYECKDVIYTFRLYEKFKSILKEQAMLVNSVHKLALALYLTEVYGVRVDAELMVATKKEMGDKIAGYLPALRTRFLAHCQVYELIAWNKELEKKKTIEGKSRVKRPVFNFASNAQMQWLLYDALKLPILKKTPAKKPATDYETIEKLIDKCPDLTLYRDYIDIKTIFGTFVEGLLERVQEGRVYPSFNVSGTATGRISHSNPNLGNLPKEGVYRNFFLPDEGHKIVGFDFSQLEVVVEANLTKDKNLEKIILQGASKHDITAQEMGIPRDLAKTINFAMGYHCGVNKLKTILKCSFQEAEFQWNRYWEVYRGCRDLKLVTDALVDAGQPVVNMMGRARRFDTVFSADWMRDSAKRAAYNHMIQGPGAEITNRAFYRCSEYLEKQHLGRALWSVHDEVLASATEATCHSTMGAMLDIANCMGTEVGFKIPLTAVAYGPLDFWAKT